jgi:phosphatidylglycerol:prolipoprotein diacylglycerol transferase
MIDWTPQAIALQIGPIPLYWYGIAYAAGLFVAYLVITRMAVTYHQNPEYVGNGMIVVGIAALIGGRLYHVIDQWALYKDDLLKIVLPPYTGLGVYGGIVTGMLAFFYLQRRWKLDVWTWADIIAPGIFVMQALGRWGNFFNQELYGPPTTLPWGIAIDCAHRVAPYTCDIVPASAHFAPLFLYESISGAIGALVLLWLASKPRPRLRRGDLLPILFIWYAIVRFLLEFLRTGNWHLEGIATAQLFSVLFIAISVAVLVYRHRTAPPEDMVGVPPRSGTTAPEAEASAAATGPGPSAPTPGDPSPDPEPLT